MSKYYDGVEYETAILSEIYLHKTVDGSLAVAR